MAVRAVAQKQMALWNHWRVFCLGFSANSRLRTGTATTPTTTTLTTTQNHRAQPTATCFLEHEGHGADVDRPGGEFSLRGT